MQITQQTLEDAARAAGHTITSFEPVGSKGALVAILGVNAAGYGIHWRPHLDDGDNRRLQIAAKIHLEFFVSAARAMAPGGRWVTVEHDGTAEGRAIAARQVVVLCAADAAHPVDAALYARPVPTPDGEPLTCDVCGAECRDPWHYSSGDKRHMHACDTCWPAIKAAPEAAQ